MIIIATHYGQFRGQILHNAAATLVTYLLDEEQKVCVLNRPLDAIGESWIDIYDSGVQVKRERTPSIRRPSGLRFLADLVFGVTSLWRYTGDKPTYFIGADPINALVGIILKRFRRVRSTVYYSLDYTPKRFENHLFNKLYHACDRFCVRHSDFVWSVSSRIVEVRRQMGLEESRNIYLPNVPPPSLISDSQKDPDIRFRLVTVGLVSEQQSYRELIDAIKLLIPKYPLITLCVIGTGPDLASLRQHVADCGLERVVTFNGYMDHEEAMILISKSGIGCAVYSGKWEFNFYGDSIKCREYLSFGLPILTTDTHSTVTDIREFCAGTICKGTARSFADGIEELLDNYSTYRADAVKLGKFHDDAHSRTYALLLKK